MPSRPSRIPPYIVYRPLSGLICFYLYISLPGLNYRGIFSLSGPNNPLSMAFFAYIIGIWPAAITALILDIFQKIRPGSIIKLGYKIFFSAVVGFVSTFIFFLILFFKDNEPIVSSDPLSSLHFAIYGACSGIVCEFIYSKF